MKRLPLSLAAALLLAGPAAPARAAEYVAEGVYFAEEEAFLREFDINDPDNKLSLMGDFEGTSMIIKVKDPSGETVGVFKPTSGNTSHIAEIVSYRLARRLGVTVCAPTVLKTLDLAALDRFQRLLKNRRFKIGPRSRHAGHIEQKERYRRAMVERLEGLETLDGAFKTFVSPLVLYEGLGRVASVREHPLAEFLRHDGPDPGNEAFDLRQCTRIYKPAGCYRARIRYADLAEQFTGILIVDALIGNVDRFAGGNLHFFSLEERYMTLKRGDFILPSASLLMLDNGAGFMRNPGYGLRVLKKEIGVTRFFREHYDDLLRLRRDLLRDRPRVLRELGLVERYRHGGRTFYPAKAFAKNLRGLIRYLDSLQKINGERTWF